MILTARLAEEDLLPFDRLRQRHFPPDRNFLRAHLTMFHRLPGEYVDRIGETLQAVSSGRSTIFAQVLGLRNLGSGVAFTIESAELKTVRDTLRHDFLPWLGSQDLQRWPPHITIQNKVSSAEAHALHRELAETFHPHQITIAGLDLWKYLDGPWALETRVSFAD